MVGRVLWILATAIACVVVAVTAFYLFQSKPPPANIPPDEAGAATPGPEVPGPASPPVARANTILSLPKIDDAAAADALAPTLISIDCERTDAQSVLQALSDVSKISFNTPRGSPLNGDPPVFSLHLQNQPLMEAFLQLEAQGLAVTPPQANAPPDQPLNTQYTQSPVRRGNLPGVWSITGPFTFILTGINHTVTLDSQGRVGPSFLGRGVGIPGDTSDNLTMQFTVRFEPKLHVLRYPMQLDVTEAVDERGHSLVPSPGAANASLNYSSSTNFPPRATLVYPPQDAGRFIKTFRGTATYTLQLDSIPLKIDDPMTNLPAEKTVNGITAAIGKGVWNEGSHVLEMTVTYKRGAFIGDWPVGAQGLAGIRPRIVVGDDRSTFVNCNASVNGDKVTATYGFMLPAVSAARGRNLPPGPPTIQSITFDFPTGTTQLTVPVEFHDLPLP